MSQHPTSIQYRLGVQIGHALVEAVENGASYDEAIETLHHSIGVMERNRALGVDLKQTGTYQ